MSVGEQWAQFEVGDATLSTRLIAAEFPKYQPLFSGPEPEWSVVLDKDATVEALSRVAFMGADGEPVNFDADASTLRLSAQSQHEGGHAAAEIAHRGLSSDAAPILFNGDYLRRGLESFKGDEVAMIVRSVDPPKPVILEDADGDDDYQYLLMPMSGAAHKAPRPAPPADTAASDSEPPSDRSE